MKEGDGPMKTLIVEYLPRGKRSHTRAVLKAFEEKLKGEVERLDLLETLPDFFTAERVMAYIRRDYLDAPEGQDGQQLEGMDRMVAQLKGADVVVLATPMHNFSLPALVKGWFDAIMLKGHTWTIGSEGYEGLMKGKKALVINASGGIYEGDMAALDHLQALARFEFQFMGFSDVRGVSAGGMNMPDVDTEAAVKAASDRARAVAAEWYV